MRRIAFWSPKGGVGKTTLALNFAASAYYAGHKVIVCDLDPQQSAVDIFNENQLPFSVVPNMPQVMPNVDFLICDYAPSMDLLPTEETIILPMRASILDLKSVGRITRLLRNKRIIKCVNGIDTRRQDERMIGMQLYSEGAQLIKDRSIYVSSMGKGQTVFQQKSYGSKDAQGEINRLLHRVLNPKA